MFGLLSYVVAPIHELSLMPMMCLPKDSHRSWGKMFNIYDIYFLLFLLKSRTLRLCTVLMIEHLIFQWLIQLFIVKQMQIINLYRLIIITDDKAGMKKVVGRTLKAISLEDYGETRANSRHDPSRNSHSRRGRKD